jgi:hypothetical protein
MTSAAFRRLWHRDRGQRSTEKEPEVEIIGFVLVLAVLAGASIVFGVDSRQLEVVRQPDIARWTR